MRRKNLLLALLFASLIGCNGSGWSSGDRVLVAKNLYDTPLAEPQRYDVVVFKFPVAPMDKSTPKNYIKRLIGLPGEIIAIFFGQVYRWTPGPGEALPFAEEDKDVDPFKLWEVRHPDSQKARELFKAGRFEILRKPPDVMLAMRRIVFDNNYPPKDLVALGIKRWDPARAKGWTELPGNRLAYQGTPGDDVQWLRYLHLAVPRGDGNPFLGKKDVKPKLITDLMGYNTFNREIGSDDPLELYWVGDLMLECNVEIAPGDGEFRLELSKGIDRFQARWNVADGVCTLVRLRDGKEEVLATQPTSLRAGGSYFVRFANFDARLTVWVDRRLPFDEGVAYPPPEVRIVGENISDELLLDRRGPTENDLEPVSIGSRGVAVTVSNLSLWRDTYYTRSPQYPDFFDEDAHRGLKLLQVMPPEAWSDPKRWDALRHQDFHVWYVQPGHYLCLGDNSTASSDSREWGLVPERLMLGRALAVYYPIQRAGPIR